MNPLYTMLMGQQAPKPAMNLYMNPYQRAGAIMQAIRNPQAFVRQMIPDLPEEIANDPNRILQYLQETRGVTNEQIRQIAGSIPRF